MKKILVFARVPMNLVCLSTIYERIKDEYCIKGTGKPLGMGLKELYERAGWDVKLVNPFFSKFLKWDMYISSDIYLLAKRAKVRVHTFHGVSFKGRAYTYKVLDYDRLFIVGPYMLRRFVEKGILREEDPRILKVGMPKLDPLVDGTWTKEKARAFLGLEGEGFVALYAPTWGAASSLELYGDLVVDVVLNLGGELIVKLHDHSLRKERWQRKLSEWESRGVCVYKGVDIVPAMAVSDVLITDLSSVANEYLLLNRPIVYLFVPSYHRRYKDTADEAMLFRTGPLVERPDPSALGKVLVESLEHPEAYEEERLYLKELLFYNPGRATEVAVSYIRELLE